MKRMVLSLLAAIALSVGVFVLSQRLGTETAMRTAPLEDVPGLRRVAPEDWADLVTSGELRGRDAVLLPMKFSADDFQSGVSAEHRGFLPAESCRECHQEYYETSVETAHAKTSMLPGPNVIRGSFAEGQNVLKTGNPRLQFRMTAGESGFFQTVQWRDSGLGTEYVRDFRFDLVLGSGNHGQSYLWWDEDRLYQMHVSYLTESDAWVNSPGPYTDGTVDYSRPVPARCLDCHATWIGVDAREVNRFDRETLLPGVTCVRCHGPGHEHVAYHRQFPEATEAHRIVNPGSLSIERQNEVCAQCHSAGEPLGNAFAYRPGEPLKSWLQLDLKSDSESNADPHSANQLARLMQSRCFTASGGLSCTKCHDPHKDQRGRLADYSARCRDCHKPDVCPDVRQLGAKAQDRCVDCHMPATRDQEVRMETDRGSLQALLRDHQIGIWPEIAERVRRDGAAEASDEAAVEQELRGARE